MGGVWSWSAAREESLKCTGAAQPHTLQTGDLSPGLREAALSEETNRPGTGSQGGNTGTGTAFNLRAKG